EANTVSYRDESGIVRVTRDVEWEQKVLAELRSWGFETENDGGEAGFFNFDNAVFSLRDGMTWRSVLSDTFAALDETRWAIDYAKELRVNVASDADVYSDAGESGGGSFALDIGVQLDDRRVSLLPP